MIRVLEETKDRRDLPLEIEDEMIDIDQTPEIEIGEKEALRNHPGNHHAITLRIEATDPLPRVDFRGILLVKVTEGEILEEEMSGILPEMAEADPTLGTGPEIHPYLTTEGHLLETVIIVEMGRRMIEMVVVIELFPRKDKEIEEEVRVEEEVEKLKKVKIVMVS